jgi:hypothetical protein
VFDVHVPHEQVHTWRSFLIHIATIVIGLFIALGLEQFAELVHHRSQRAELERQMHEQLVSDAEITSRDLRQLAEARQRLVPLRAAIEQRVHDPSPSSSAVVRATQRSISLPPIQLSIGRGDQIVPGLAPYEAAKENATIGLLPVNRIRIYGRVDANLQRLDVASRELTEAYANLAAFAERFTDSPGVAELGDELLAPDVASLTPGELDQYLTLVATLIKKNDVLSKRLIMFGSLCQATLQGAQDEVDLVHRATLLEQSVAAGAKDPK